MLTLPAGDRTEPIDNLTGSLAPASPPHTHTDAITVAMGDSNFLHISITLIDSGEVTIDKINYPGLRAAIVHFSSNAYKDIITLTGAVTVKEAPPPVPTARPGPTAAPAGPPVPERTAPAPPPRTTPQPPPEEDENMYEVPVKLDFTSPHIYASTISSDEDDVYETPDYEKMDAASKDQGGSHDMYNEEEEEEESTWVACHLPIFHRRCCTEGRLPSSTAAAALRVACRRLSCLGSVHHARVLSQRLHNVLGSVMPIKSADVAPLPRPPPAPALFLIAPTDTWCRARF